MSSLLGEYHCKLDDKGRVKVPSELKRKLQKFSADGRDVVILKRGFEGCLECFPESSWLLELVKVEGRINSFREDDRTFTRKFLDGIKEVVLDSADRMLIPANLLASAGIKGELVILGVLNRLELWDPEKLRKHREDSEEGYAELAARVMGPS
ncbi:MAG: division/cell wall cluster transcriptional repressor MraZ [Bacteroidetes bacterium]|nr:division/cell wall cluster transcriptional repressor MraZ [Bacteroidota bacterium]